MNGKKAKALRRMAKEIAIQNEYQMETGYTKGKDKRNIEKLKRKVKEGIPVYHSPVGTIILGPCLRKVYKELKKEVKAYTMVYDSP